MAVADDVESMNPDPDNGGDQERGAGLQRHLGNIGELLPEEEKTEDAQEEGGHQGQVGHQRRRTGARGQGLCGLHDGVAVPHGVAHRLSARLALHAGHLVGKPARPLAP